MNHPPAADGRPSFWERPSRALPDREKHRREATLVGQAPLTVVNGLSSHCKEVYPLTDLWRSDILQMPRFSWLAGGWMHFHQLRRREFITLLGGAAE
jgi:hypothetical protein